MPNNYYDFPAARGAGRAAIVSAFLVGRDTAGAIGAGKVSLSSALAGVDLPVARGAGAASEHDGLSHSETVAAQGAGLGAAPGRTVVRESPIVRGAGAMSAINSTVAIDAPLAHAGGSAHISDATVATDQPKAQSGGRISCGNLVPAVEIVSARGATAVVSTDFLKVKDQANARGAGQSALSLARAIVEVVDAVGGGRASAITALVGTEQVTAYGAGTGSAAAGFRFDIGSLIRNVRANAKAALPECLDFPEALPDATLFKAGLKLPLLVLNFGVPEPVSDMAVNDVTQAVKCEFTYIAHTTANGVADTAQDIRRRLARLEAALLADYRQIAGTGAPTCNNTMLVSSPAQKANPYQQYLADNGQKASSMGMVMQFTVIESLVHDG